MYDKLEQLELKQEKILGFRNMQEKLENFITDPTANISKLKTYRFSVTKY